MESKLADRIRKVLGKDWPYVVALLLITGIAHRVWFHLGVSLHFGDWMQWSTTGTKELYRTWSAYMSVSDLGGPNVSLFFLPFIAAWSFWVNAGTSYATAFQLVNLIPVAILSVLAPFYFVRGKVSHPLSAFITAMVYATGTYFLARQTSQVTIAFVYSLAPLLFLLLEKALVSRKRPDLWFLLGLLFSVAIGYELRIVFLLTPILVAYALILYWKELWPNRWQILGVVLAVVLLNLYWLLPTIFGGGAGDVGALANRGVFGSWLVNVRSALTTNDWGWTGGALANDFNPRPILWYLWAAPLVAVVGLLNARKSDRKRMLFFAILVLVGLLLAKQSDEPFKGLYLWLYQNAPGFNLYRESSKFHLLTAFGYLGLLPYALEYLSEKRNRYPLYAMSAVALIGMSLLNLRPLVTRSINTLFVARHEPADYTVLNAAINIDADWYRILWVPRIIQWGEYNSVHPRLSAVDLSVTDWSVGQVVPNGITYPAGLQIMAPLRQSYSQNLLNQSGIRYLVLPQHDFENEDDNFKYYAAREYFAESLAKLAYIQPRFPELSQVKVYENTGYLPKIYLTSESVSAAESPRVIAEPAYVQVNTGQLEITVKGLTQTSYLEFTDRYNANLQLVAGTGLGQVLSGSLLPTKPERTEFGLTQFKLDPAELAKGQYTGVTVHSDGSVDLTFTLFYRGQRFYYIGLAISLAALAAGFGLLVASAFMKRRTRQTSS